MPYRPDLSPYPNVNPDVSIRILNVGWLAKGKPFPRGSVPLAFATELRQLVEQAEHPTGESRVCEFCERPADIIANDPAYETVWELFRSGHAEIHVHSADKTVYFAPDLILHYVAEHQYRPPDEFIEAVLQQRRERDELQVSPKAQELLRHLEFAFAGVQLGNGVSLHQTIAIDEREMGESEAYLRSKDEQHDWRKLIDDPELYEVVGIGGPAFFDAEGLRFHTPAYLSSFVKQPRRASETGAFEFFIYALTSVDDPDDREDMKQHHRQRLALLNEAQRRCVRDVLLYLRAVLELDDPGLDRALHGFWSS
jgi:hypothetical protein